MTCPLDEVGGVIIAFVVVELFLTCEGRGVSLIRCGDGDGGLNVLCRSYKCSQS